MYGGAIQTAGTVKARKSDLSAEVRGLDKELKDLQATLLECKAGYFTTKAVDGYTVLPTVRKTFHTGSKPRG